MCRGGMARGTGGGVGERRGWLCSKSNGGRRGRSEGLGRVTGRTGESPEREWNQYVEASVCPWPHMRVSVPGEAKHASIYPVGRGEGGGWAKAGAPHPSLVQPSGPGEYAPFGCVIVYVTSGYANVTGIPHRCLWSHSGIGENVFLAKIVIRSLGHKQCYRRASGMN